MVKEYKDIICAAIIAVAIILATLIHGCYSRYDLHGLASNERFGVIIDHLTGNAYFEKLGK